MDQSAKNYLAVIRPENLDRLVKSGLDFYYVSSSAGSRIKLGDRIVLYKSRNRQSSAKPGGIVGAFEVTGEPQRANRGPFILMYPFRVPWRPIVTSFEHPLPLGPLVPMLHMFPNKRNYGSALQGSMKHLRAEDYEIIIDSLKRHLATTS